MLVLLYNTLFEKCFRNKVINIIIIINMVIIY